MRYRVAIIFLGLVVVILLVSFNPLAVLIPSFRYSIEEDINESGIRTIKQRNNVVYHDVLGGQIELNLSKFTYSWDGSKSYLISVSFGARDWILIESGPSLLFLIDGEKLFLPGKGSTGHRTDLGYKVLEVASYHIHPDEIARLANARLVKVRILGSEGIQEFVLKPKYIERFKDFYLRFVN